MSKYYINVKLENGEYKDAKLVKKGLLSRKKYELKDKEELFDDMKDNKVNFITASNNKAALISNIDDVIKYAYKTKDIKFERTMKRIIAGGAFIIGLTAAYAFSNRDHVKRNYDHYEHQVRNLNDENEEIETGNEYDNSSISTNNLLDNLEDYLVPMKAEKHVINDQNISFEKEEKIPMPKEKYVYQFNFDDRSNDFKDEILSKYGDIINNYAEAYGVDANLITAIICQENPTNIINDKDYGGYGIMAIEAVNNGATYSAHNNLTNQTDTITIDTERCKTDGKYSIQVGTMILNYCYNYVQSKNVDNKFSKEDEIILSLFAYNKGIGTVKNAMKETNNLTECINNIKSQKLGDDLYLEHVLSRMEDGSTITFKDKNGIETSILIDNTNVDKYKKNSL